jgi:hypothetical protein
MQPKEERIWTRESLIKLLETSNLGCGKALYGLFQRQTAAEQAQNQTVEHNGRGFNGKDAEWLSDIAKKLPRYDYRMTPRQHKAVARALKKYCRQLLEIIEERGGKVDWEKGRKSAKAKTPISEPAESLEAEVARVDAQTRAGRTDQFGLF